ncbi:MAG TPA: helix-turn-helix transcriptional regulator, partial [Chthoniobacterales bacterium]
VERGLTFKEAARVLGVSPKVARCHHRQAGGKPARSDSTWPGSPRRAAEVLERPEMYRQRTGLTWKELAARCGSSARLVSQCHTGKRVPSDYTLNKVEGFLSGELA